MWKILYLVNILFIFLKHLITTCKKENYYQNGEIRSKGDFSSNSQKDGKWDYFNEDGSLHITEIWKDGEFIK